MNWHHDPPVPLLAASHAMSAPFGSPDVPLFSFPTVHRKKVVAAFDGGRITSDGGVMLLGAVERQLGIADTLARLISDPRNQALVTHGVDDILRARILAISCGYEDADDLDVLRTDPGFKVACGRLPDSGDDLCSQPTVSRWENAPTLREVVRMTYAMIDVYCRSYAHPPAAVTFDIDDTCDVADGNQQLALFHAYYDERCFLPIHVYDAANARPVVVVFRPGKTPSGEEVRSHLRRMVRRIRSHWPDTRITVRGDSHYGRREVMAWCEANGLHYIFGLSGNAVLDQMVEPSRLNSCLLIDTAATAHLPRPRAQGECHLNFAEGCHLYIALTRPGLRFHVYGYRLGDRAQPVAVISRRHPRREHDCRWSYRGSCRGDCCDDEGPFGVDLRSHRQAKTTGGTWLRTVGAGQASVPARGLDWGRSRRTVRGPYRERHSRRSP